MKKNIFIGILVLINLSLITFSILKHMEASDSKKEAENAMVEAVQNAAEAQVQSEYALEAAAVAAKEQANAEAAMAELNKCQKR